MISNERSDSGVARQRHAGRGRARATSALAGLGAIALLAASTPAAGAQERPTPGASSAAAAPAWIRARLDGRLDSLTRTAVERLIDSARATGLPAEPLVDKALEGASKRAPREAILRAVRGLVADLGAARQSLGMQALPGELTAGASALRGGVDGQVLRRLRDERSGQPLAVPLGVLADLVARGVPAATASKAVLSLTEVGMADEQLVAFRRDVERDIGVGAPPAVATMLREGRALLNLQPVASGGVPRPPEVPRRPKP